MSDVSTTTANPKLLSALSALMEPAEWEALRLDPAGSVSILDGDGVATKPATHKDVVDGREITVAYCLQRVGDRTFLEFTLPYVMDTYPYTVRLPESLEGERLHREICAQIRRFARSSAQ
jgi:hypothetical protein